MKKIYFIVLVGFFLLHVSCDRIEGEGPIVTQELHLNEFDEIYLEESFNVIIMSGELQKVEVTGYLNIIDRIKRQVNNKCWDIELLKGRYINWGDVEITITVPDISKVSVAGPGRVLMDRFVVDDLSLRVSGSGMISASQGLAVDDKVKLSVSGSGMIDVAQLECVSVKSIIAGSGKIDLKGACKEHSIEITGSGQIKAYDLASNDSQVYVAGSGDAYLAVSDELDVKIVGSGNVYYIGYPTLISNITGSGSVRDRN